MIQQERFNMNKYLRIASLSIFSLALMACSKMDENAALQSSDTLVILAGSELKDMEPILQEAQKQSGVKYTISYSGTIDGMERLSNGEKADIAWFSQGRYITENPELSKKAAFSEKIMYSPVAIGLRPSSVVKLQPSEKVTWSQVYDWVDKKGATYAMTDPSTSNTGFVGLSGIAYAKANTGESLKVEDIKAPVMQRFFKGHAVNAGSSGYLMEAFKNSSADFVINYESLLLQYNQSNKPLKIILPFEGVVTADYPFVLMSKEKKDAYMKFTEVLKSDHIQKMIVKQTNRRSINAQITKDSGLFDLTQMLIEMPFVPSVQMSEALLGAYFNQFKKPAAISFVLDTSGSMSGRRDEEMKKAINSISVNVNSSSQYAAIREKEKVFVAPFSSALYDFREMTGNSKMETRINLSGYVSKLHPSGGTALFSSTGQVYEKMVQMSAQSPDFAYSVVVLTDGAADDNLANFKRFYHGASNVKIFTIIFGDADVEQLKVMSEMTKGKVFDGREGLEKIFKEIRSYQ